MRRGGVARGLAALRRAAGRRDRPRRQAPPRLPDARGRRDRRGRGGREAMPLTVGTAGHIDLGNAPLELPDGTQLSVVDVPGHERFVRTMVAGATGIDLFLLVIDASEGARPQTHEHLAILRLLGIEQGVVAVTKSDLVDEETLELARAEAEELVPGVPVVAVSARTGT